MKSLPFAFTLITLMWSTVSHGQAGLELIVKPIDQLHPDLGTDIARDFIIAAADR